MYTVSSQFLESIRGAHEVSTRVDVYLNGALVLGNLPFTDGDVQVNSGTGVRRTLNLSVPDISLWDVLSPIGTELRVYRGVRFPGVAAPELVPLGIFVIDSQTLSLGPGGTISITAPDRWAKIQRAKFENPQSSVKGSQIVDEIARIALLALPGISVTATSTSTATVVTSVVWDQDRDTAITGMAASIGAEVYFDWTGNLLIRDAPLLAAAVIPWRIDEGTTGVLLGGDRSRSREKTYNVVVVSAANVDGLAPFATQYVADTDPTSPTYIGGSMGRVPYFYSSPLISTTAQALAAGRTILNRAKGLEAQLNVEAAVNPALDRGDVFHAILPNGVVERHICDSFNVPLTEDGTQTITTRSSRPDGDVPSTE